MLSEDLSASFADLLDSDFQDHVIAAMKEWCDDYRYASGEAYANLVLTDISRPLRWWLNGQHYEKLDNLQKIELAKAFLARADDIVYLLRYKTRSLYPEHVSMLDDAWSAFRFGENPEIIADRVLHKRRELAEQEREFRKQAALERFQALGANAARKYDADDRKGWGKTAKKILRRDGKRIKSMRILAQEIINEIGCSFEAFDTIRKDEEIIKIYKEHSLKNNFG